MTIYLVTRTCDHEYGCTENVAMFTTREQAESFIQKNGGYGSWTDWRGTKHPEYYIEEWDIEDDDLS